MSKVSRWTKRVSHSTQEIVRDVACVLSGYREFQRQGETSEQAYYCLRRLYRTTNGRFNDAMGSLCKRLHPKHPAALQESLFDDASQSEINRIATALRRDGFYEFDRRLPPELCQQLLQFSLATPGTAISLDQQPHPRSLFDRCHPDTVRHQFDASDLFANPTIQQLATDPYFFGIAQEYLGFNPVQDLLTMWWSAPGDPRLQSRAAQQYHFDMDRFRFVKFFVYLTDVGPDNGPHCYVRGSHHRKPAALLRDERLTDDEVAAHYRAEDLCELTGPVGTILAVDTRGFHKGKPLVSGDRLIFQIQFADSLFGQNYPPIEVPDSIDATTQRRLQANRRCYSNFDLSRSGQSPCPATSGTVD